MIELYDMAFMTSATTGTGTLTLGVAVGGYQSFANAGVANQANITYGIIDTANNWEVGWGIYNSAATTLTRNPIYSSNSTSLNGLLNCSGSEVVYITLLAECLNTFLAINSISVGSNIVINTSALVIGNSTANTFANSIEFSVANSTSSLLLTPIEIAIGSNVLINTISCFYGNSTVNSFGNSIIEIIANTVSQTVFTAVSWSTGNSTANSFGNSIIEMVSNSTSQTVITPITISIGNSTANSSGNSTADWVINSTANTIITPGTITLAGAGSNTGLILGTNSQGTTIGSNGFTFLPNGLLLQWGAISVANASTSFAFPTTFTTNCFALTVTVANSTAGDGFQNLVAAAVISSTSHFAATSGNNSTARTCYFIAIGH